MLTGLITPNFSWEEARCNCNGKFCKGLPKDVWNVAGTAHFMQEIRRIFKDRPVIVSSWYRCPEWNKIVGGAQFSQHLYGKACDIRVAGLTPGVVQSILYPYVGELIGGLGIYKTFTHVDWRTNPEIWRG